LVVMEVVVVLVVDMEVVEVLELEDMLITEKTTLVRTTIASKSEKQKTMKTLKPRLLMQMAVFLKILKPR